MNPSMPSQPHATSAPGRPATPAHDTPSSGPDRLSATPTAAPPREHDLPPDAGAIEYASWLRLLRWPHA